MIEYCIKKYLVFYISCLSYNTKINKSVLAAFHLNCNFNVLNSMEVIVNKFLI